LAVSFGIHPEPCYLMLLHSSSLHNFLWGTVSFITNNYFTIHNNKVTKFESKKLAQPPTHNRIRNE